MTNSSPERKIYSFLGDPILWTILLIALILRLYLASTTSYIWDEEREFLPIAQSISLSSDSLHLPIRTQNHGALPAYFIKAGSIIGGENVLGFRLSSILAGGLTILVVALLAFIWSGHEAALWSAALLTFNEYHIFVSILAIQKTFFLLFSSLAAYSFVLAMHRNQIRWLFFTSAFTAIGILCYEITFLLVPIFAFSILISSYRKWLYRIELYLSALVALVILSPDLYWNLLANSSEKVSYSDHLLKLDSLGFTAHYFLFFFRDLVATVYSFFDRTLYDPAAEYASMNFFFGFILFAGVVAYSICFVVNRRLRGDATLFFLLFFFWSSLCFFIFIRPGITPGMDSMLWPWVDITIIPGIILVGSLVSQTHNKWRCSILLITCAGVIFSSYSTVMTRLATPSRGISFYPAFISSPNEELVDVRAVFNFCFLCDNDPEVKLIDVGIINSYGSIDSIAYSQDVEGAEIGTSDTLFRLRAVSGEPENKVWPITRIYNIEYQLTYSSGSKRILHGNVYATNKPLKSITK
jgi:4-amino-4-deoxy-L-arabinose transferase-like glycosyltransferase